LRHNLPKIRAATKPIRADSKLVSHTAGIISKGVTEPRELRTAATVVGIAWMEAVFSRISRQSSSPATLLQPIAKRLAA
jgi:hypothetical protein